MPEIASRLTDLPAPSPELVLVRVCVEAYLATAHVKPRQRARAFLRVASTILADEESVALTFPIRPSADARAVTEARRQAIAVFRQYIPVFMARLPDELEP